MFSPSSISRGEALSSDNRKQVLREGEALGGDGGWGGGQQENRGYKCAVWRTGEADRLQKKAPALSPAPKMEVSQAKSWCPSQLKE